MLTRQGHSVLCDDVFRLFVGSTVTCASYFPDLAHSYVRHLIIPSLLDSLRLVL